VPRSRTDGLRRRIEGALPDRPFTVELWDGSRIPSTRHGPTLTVRSPRAIGHLLRAPGELGLGRAYVCGEIDVDDLDGIVALLGRWQPPAISLPQRLRFGAAALRAAGLHRRPPPPAAELRPRRRGRHTKRRDAEAVRHHYDVSNEFFALFLDETMTYSCALFEDDAETLEEAQRAKLELICRKLELEPGQRLLDVGSGWGSLGIHAATQHGASVLGITLSEPQARLATERARDAGVADRVEFRVMDYRDLEGERFDAIASIGMVEHVGESRIDEYAALLAAALSPGGRILNHGIVYIPPTYGSHLGGEFSRRYVFPDGELLNLSRMLAAFERAGLEALHVEDLHLDYAETLRHWTARFDDRLADAERLGGTERARVWRLYLRAARNAFETGHNAVYQVLCSQPLSESPRRLPTGRTHEPARRRVPTAVAG
jgi:cyclopropane-fatty-acyl-phospholipid synthase